MKMHRRWSGHENEEDEEVKEEDILVAKDVEKKQWMI